MITRLKGFDGLRAIAVSMVIISHSMGTSDFYLPEMLVRIFGNGGTGVRIFFVISGFLITYLLLNELNNNKRIDLRAFFIRRSLRIFPAFFTYILAIFLLAQYKIIDISNSHLISAATFTWNYGHLWITENANDAWFLGHFWTLALEEQYYLFWPALLVLSGVGKAKNIAILLVLLMPVIRVLSYFIFPDSRGQLGMMFHTALDPILVGSIGGVLFYKNKQIIRKMQSSIFCGCCVIFIFFISPIIGQYVRGYVVVIGATLESLSILYLIIWLQSNSNSYFLKVLEFKWIKYVGTISFSLYLWQQLFLTPLNSTILGALPINIISVFLVAIFSYHIIERPFLNLRDRIKLRNM
jgi:peptidoglycan/LPS O-acetylase OafA/YrhL